MVSLQHLRTLHSVRLHGSIHAAAKALHLSPSAVSQQIKALGAECGFPLVEPDGRGIRLTEDGRRIADTGLRMAELWTSSVAGGPARRAADSARRRVRIGAFPSAMTCCVLPAIKGAETVPFDTSLYETSPHEGRNLTEQGTLDAALCIQGPDDGAARTLCSVPLHQDPFLFVGPPALVSAVSRPGAVQTLSDVPWVLPREGSDCDGLITAHFAGYRVSARAVARTDDWDLAQEIALALHALVLVPSSVLVARSDLARALEAGGVPAPTRTVVFVAHAAAELAPWFALLRKRFQQAYTRTTGVVYGT